MFRFKQFSIASFALAALALSGCYIVNSSTISSTAAKGGNPITASSSDWGVLHLTAPQGLTSTVDSQLMGQCPSGKVANISTSLATREFFLAQMYTVTASGNCL
jgi:hypothetical protein